ncbi:MAG: ATP-binding protein [Candidatus Anammoxibacter sp.]
MKVQKLIISGFCIIVILLIILGVFALSKMQSLALNTENIYKHPFAVSNAARNINLNLISMHRSMKDVVLSESEDQLSIAIECVNENEKNVFKEFDIVFGCFLGNKTDIEKVYRAFTDWKAIREEVIAFIRNGNVKEAANITKCKGAKHVAYLNKLTHKLVLFAANKADSFFMDAMRHKKSSLFVVSCLLAAIVTISIAISVFVVTAFNRSEKKEQGYIKKLHATQDLLIHTEKLSAIGKLSASIAHEFNNPISGIRNVLESVADNDFDKEDEEEKRSLLVMAIRECNRIARLVKNLNDFNRPSTGEIIPINIEESINDVIFLYKKKLKERNIELETKYGNKRLRIEGVEDQIKQVFLNIIQNAEESIAENEGGKITISTERINAKGIIRIQDTGCGINQDIIPHLFEPFFSTKSSSKGTGLGLSVCYGIIKAHNGDIQIKNAPGKGAIFTITLPIKGGA